MPELLLLAGARGREIAAVPGDTVLEALLRAGEPIETVCKGKGVCGACRVRVADGCFGKLSPPAAAEARILTFLRRHEENQQPVAYRLACRIVLTPALSGLRVTPEPFNPHPPRQENKS